MKRTIDAHARENIARLAEEAQKKGKIFALTKDGKPVAVIMGYDELRAIRQSNRIISDKEFADDMRTGIRELRNHKERVYPIEELACW